MKNWEKPEIRSIDVNSTSTKADGKNTDDAFTPDS